MSDCCVYCASAGPLTDDHVPPRVVFTKPRPSNLITVPACIACNRRFSRQDERFASFLSLFVGIESERTNQLHQKNIRIVSHNQKLRRTIRSRIRPVWVQDGNLITGTAQGVHWPAAEHDAMITRFIKALYYNCFKRALPLHVPVEASLSQPFTGALFEMWRSLPGGNIGSAGEFRYRYGYLEEDPESSFWMLIFYDRHFVSGHTGLRFRIAIK
jgi:hypothetical protein